MTATPDMSEGARKILRLLKQLEHREHNYLPGGHFEAIFKNVEDFHAAALELQTFGLVDVYQRTWAVALTGKGERLVYSN